MSEQFVKLHKWMGGMGLTPNELMIFAVIHSYTEYGRGYDGGLAGLTEWTGCSERTVKRTVRQLVEAGWIINSKPSKGRVACLYHSNGDKIAPLREDKMTPLTVTKCPLNGDKMSPDNKDNKDIDNPPTPLKGGSAHADAKPERKRRSSVKRRRAVDIIPSGIDYSTEGLKKMGISQGEEFYDSLDELRIN